jgi:acetolactate synthase-1/2/3 large subunit
MMRVADFIANFIVGKGVKDFFLLPGGGAMYLVDALGNHQDLNFIAMHHEQSVSIAAESYSRITENFGVGLVTTGPGATNAITAVVGAWIESVPLMIISGQVKRSDLIGNRNIRQSGVQEVDIISMVKNHTKYAITIDEPKKIKYYLEKAYFEMMNGRKGPVWIDVPLDVQASLIDNKELIMKDENNKELRVKNRELEEKLSIINYQLSISKKPLILAGNGTVSYTHLTLPTIA